MKKADGKLWTFEDLWTTKENGKIIAEKYFKEAKKIVALNTAKHYKFFSYHPDGEDVRKWLA